MQKPDKHRRTGGRSGRLLAREASPSAAVWPGLEGGRYRPLSDADLWRIHASVIEVLSTIGMADASPDLIVLARDRGCTLTDRGRLTFPAALIEDVLATAPREITMYGRDGKDSIHVGDRRVFFATSGEAIAIVDPESGAYRPSTLND